MPYVGRDLNVGDRIKLSVTGSTPATSFVLQNAGVNYQASASTNVIVSVGGVVQSPGVAYQINGSTLDFLGVSVAAADIDFVVAMGQSVDVGTPSAGTVDSSKLSTNFYVENPVTYSNISIVSGNNAMAAGPITISGTVTDPSGSTFTVV